MSPQSFQRITEWRINKGKFQKWNQRNQLVAAIAIQACLGDFSDHRGGHTCAIYHLDVEPVASGDD